MTSLLLLLSGMLMIAKTAQAIANARVSWLKASAIASTPSTSPIPADTSPAQAMKSRRLEFVRLVLGEANALLAICALALVAFMPSAPLDSRVAALLVFWLVIALRP